MRACSSCRLARGHAISCVLHQRMLEQIARTRRDALPEGPVGLGAFPGRFLCREIEFIAQTYLTDIYTGFGPRIARRQRREVSSYVRVTMAWELLRR